MTALVHALGRNTRSRAAVDAAAIIAGSLLIAGLAQLSMPLPFTPVPITGQTLGVLLVGTSLGALRGGMSVGLYLVEGALGAPFFADGAHGISVLGASSASGGYLWGFVVAAAVIGFLAERGWTDKIGSAIGAMFLGELIIYAVGVTWLAFALDVGGEQAMEYGLYPFIVGDVVKLLLAASVLPAAVRLVGRREGRDRR